MTGTIKTLLKDKGCGFIRGEDGKEYFFHYTALQGVKFDELTVQRQVTFEPGEGAKGPRAEDVSV